MTPDSFEVNHSADGTGITLVFRKEGEKPESVTIRVDPQTANAIEGNIKRAINDAHARRKAIRRANKLQEIE